MVATRQLTLSSYSRQGGSFRIQPARIKLMAKRLRTRQHDVQYAQTETHRHLQMKTIGRHTLSAVILLALTATGSLPLSAAIIYKYQDN